MPSRAMKQHNDTLHNDTQHNDTQHNAAQQNNKNTTVSITALDTIMLSGVYAVCYLCCVLFMVSVVYAECRLC